MSDYLAGIVVGVMAALIATLPIIATLHAAWNRLSRITEEATREVLRLRERIEELEKPVNRPISHHPNPNRTTRTMWG